MNTFNRIITGTFEVLVSPFNWLSPAGVLVGCGILTGLLITWVHRFASKQAVIRILAERTRAELLAVRLFRDDLRATLRSQATLLRLAAVRLGYTLPAFLVLSIPILLLLVQLAIRFQYRPLAPGEVALVQLDLDPRAWDLADDVRLLASPGIQIESPPLRNGREHAVYWRIRPIQPTSGKLSFDFGNQVVEKNCVVAESTRLQAVSVRRAGSHLTDRVLHPSEAAVPVGGPVRAIVLTYPHRSTPLFGLEVPWWLTFVVVATATALVAKNWMGVEF